MLLFDSDYMRGAHSEILRRLCETNLEQSVGYGLDPYCANAKNLIRAACGFNDEGEVFFLASGHKVSYT